MGRIQSTIGLITGIPIADTVDQLMQIAARPRDLLIKRTDNLRSEQVAMAELAALLLGVQYAVGYLGKDDLYNQRFVVSSSPTILNATVTGQPAEPQRFEVLRGQDAPGRVQGWASPYYGERMPIPTLETAWRYALPLRTITVVSPKTITKATRIDQPRAHERWALTARDTSWIMELARPRRAAEATFLACTDEAASSTV